MLSTNDSMNPNTPGVEKLRAITDETHKLGTDADGTDHYCDMARDIVWVETETGEIGGIQQIPTLSAYVDKVDDVVGWEEHSYDARSMDEWLEDIMGELEFTPATEVA